MQFRIIRRTKFVKVAAMRLYEPLILVLVASCLSAAEHASEIPSYVKICRQSDPNFNSCLKESATALQPYLKDGIPDLRIPPFEPFHVDEINSNHHSDSMDFDAKYTNVSIYGMSNFILNYAKYEHDNGMLGLKFQFPHLMLNATYNLVGKIMSRTIDGTGIGQMEFEHVKVDCSLYVQHYVNETTGDIHSNMTDVVTHLQIEHGTVTLDNLFNGDEVLTNATNLFLNNNWKLLEPEIKPEMERIVSKHVKDIFNGIFKTYPNKVLLPL